MFEILLKITKKFNYLYQVVNKRKGKLLKVQ